MIVIGALLLVWGVLGVIGATMATESSSNSAAMPAGSEPAVGDCITIAELSVREHAMRPVDCSDHQAVLQVAAQVDHDAVCPDGHRLDSRQYNLLIVDDKTYCLAPNLFEGDCYTRTPDGVLLVPVDCTSSKAQYEVAKRVDGGTDKSACGPGGGANLYSTPARPYCLVPAN